MDVASPSEPTLEVRVPWVRGTPSTMALPSAVLEIERLADVLTMDAWRSLEEAEREELRKLLPERAADGGGDAGDDAVLAPLFDESAPFHFGHPAVDALRRLQSGRYHPKVAEYFAANQLLQRRQHAHDVRNYHDGFVRRCRDMRDVFTTCGRTKSALDDRLRRWRVYTGADGAPGPDAAAAAAASAAPGGADAAAPGGGDDGDAVAATAGAPPLVSPEDLATANAYEADYYKRLGKRRRGVQYGQPSSSSAAPAAPDGAPPAPEPSKRERGEREPRNDSAIPRNLVSAVLRSVTSATNKARAALLADPSADPRNLKLPDIKVDELHQFLEIDDALVKEAQKKGRAVDVRRYVRDVVLWLSQPSQPVVDGYSSGGGCELDYDPDTGTVARSALKDKRGLQAHFKDVR